MDEEAKMSEIKGLAYLVENSAIVLCHSRQKGHQLPITDCDCVLCKHLNIRAFGAGIMDTVWKPTNERIIEREQANDD